jgi:hypothetical protein
MEDEENGTAKKEQSILYTLLLCNDCIRCSYASLGFL